MNPTAALSIAIVSGCIVVPILVFMGFRTWRIWRRVDNTRDAASALIDTHVATLQRRAEHTAQLVEASTLQGADLATDVAQLRDDVHNLQWLLQRIGVERERFTRTLLDMMLPTKSSSRKRDET